MADIYSLIPKSFSRTDTASYTLDDIRKEVNEICVWLDYMWGHEKKMQNVQFRVGWNDLWVFVTKTVITNMFSRSLIGISR